jgi:hypothetical protein
VLLHAESSKINTNRGLKNRIFILSKKKDLKIICKYSFLKFSLLALRHYFIPFKTFCSAKPLKKFIGIGA